MLLLTAIVLTLKELLSSDESTTIDVAEQETKFISMIEGGIQAQEMLLKKIESSDQPTGTVELTQESEKAPSKK